MTELEGRYGRQMLLPELGEEGQERLRKAKVLIVGVGGLGSPIALYLTGAGVGTLGLVDEDVVSLNNLHRQILYSESEVGQAKVHCAARRLQALNSEVTLMPHHLRLNKENAARLIQAYDLVVDGCDNFSTRYLLSDVCAAANKPYVYGAICGFEGQVSVFNHPAAPCTYRDLYPDEAQMLRMPPPSKAVMGVTPALVGSVQAAEVLKLIGGYGEPLAGKLWVVDVRTMQVVVVNLPSAHRFTNTN